MDSQMKKTVFVTGTDSGLGLSLVKRFLEGGFVVLAGVYRSATGLNILTGEYGDSLALIPLDVSDMNSICEAAQQVTKQTNALDIVINNAGIHLNDTKTSLEQLELGNEGLQ